ncbi:uncharacterized protein LOC114763092 [Neltuma alba]|uniref:uncharacterized protein LOC114763092 n=1 Tax=Neltuma alba TaxID=207710 RepID=UPI0010A455F4|nr:uncharacterized protein LOC114763092 [Prosopis alba]
MKEEIEALERNGTWTLKELPKGKRAIDSKWVYKRKFKPNGTLERNKARLVAKGMQKTFAAILIYVDDIIITRNDEGKIAEIKKHLHKNFSIKDLGPLKYFLGIEVTKLKEGVVLSQQKYVLDILKDAKMENCRPTSTPMEENCNLEPPEGYEVVDEGRYRRLIGQLLYLIVTRPDLVYPVNVLS